MPLPNGCVYVGGQFDPEQFSDQFDVASMVCGPYFVAAQDEFSPVQATQVYSNVQAQDVFNGAASEEAN